MNESLTIAMNQILQKHYAACMFDYDGTLIELGYHMPVPEYIPSVLRATSQKAYMAICTARIFSQAFKHADEILGESFDELKTRWIWICENGAAGYAYDSKTERFEEFYRVPFPEKTMSYATFQSLVIDRFRDLTEEISIHDSVMILRPKNLPTLTVEEMLSICSTLERMGLDLIRQHHLENEIRLVNSGIGVIFCGVNADKDRGILEFGKYLQQKGLPLNEPFRDIICFGDRPVSHGNDEQFLSGRYGTCVNVGITLVPRDDLISVIDGDSKRLTGPRATSYLLRRLLF